MANSTSGSTKQFVRYVYALIFLLLGIAPQTHGQNLSSDSMRLMNSIHELIKKYKTPDCAIRIIRNDSITFQFDKNPENHNTNYYIGSCSKSFTALAMLQLVDAGKVNLDTPIVRYLPWFKLKDANQSNQISVRHILTQTSGLKTADGYIDIKTTDQSNYERKLAARLQQLELKWAPGTGFNYCNLNYTLAGLIISNKANESYASFLKRNIFSKIGMSRTYASLDETKSKDLVPGYQNILKLYTYPTRLSYSDFRVAEGYINSNTDDLALYLQCIRDSCKTRNGEMLLTPNSYNLLTTPLKHGYAMGWMGSHIEYVNSFARKYDLSFLYHTGMVENYNAVLALYPDRKTNIIILSNINSLEFSLEVMKTILVAFKGDLYTPESSLESTIRNIVLIAFIVLIAAIIYSIYRWKQYQFKFGFTSRLNAIIPLLIGMVFSIAPLFLVPQVNNISLQDLASYFPDFSYGLIGLSGLGIILSIINYQKVYAKRNRDH